MNSQDMACGPISGGFIVALREPPPEDCYGWDPAMEWAEPLFNKSKVNWAGRTLVKYAREQIMDADDFDKMNAIINNWRSSHNFPLNTFHIGLKTRAQKIDARAITAQRIKRLASIALKFERYPNYFLDTKIFRELVDETMRSTQAIVGGKRTMAQQLQLL